MDLNKVILVGRATSDPILKTTPGGTSVSTMGLATNRVWTDKAGAKQTETEFHNVVFWGKQAEVASQFVVKGSTLLVEGRLHTRSWQGKDGQQRKTVEIQCEKVSFGPKPQGATVNGRVQTQSQIQEEVEEIKAEDLPF